MMPTSSSLVALEVMTTSSATGDDKVGIMTNLCFHCAVFCVSLNWIMTEAHGANPHGN